jgi:hypothetical protein
MKQILLRSILIALLVTSFGFCGEWLFHQNQIDNAINNSTVKSVYWNGSRFVIQVTDPDGKIELWTEDELPRSRIIRNDGSIVELDGSTLGLRR